MSPMTKDHDIDDILESLEELLFEGKTQDDDQYDTQSDADGSKPEAVVNSQHSPFLLSVDVKNDDVDEIEAESLMSARVLLTENMLEDNPQVQLPLVEKIASDMIEASQIMDIPKIHLGPEMEIAFPTFMAAERSQDVSLSFEIEHETTETTAQDPSFNQQRVEQLLEDVGDDVLHELQLILPKMIKSSLKRHLEALNNEEMKESDKHE